MYRLDTLTRSLVLLALVALALLTSIASANDDSPTVAERYGPVATTSVPFSYISAPTTPYTSIALQTDTYWFDAAMRYSAAPTPTASSNDSYWFEVALRYADAGDPFRPQISAER